MKENKEFSRVIAIDAGSLISGVCVLDCNQIIIGFNCDNDKLCGLIKKYSVAGNTLVLIEDIRPYDNKLSSQVIDTCKFIGVICDRLKFRLKLPFELISRSYVKKWIFSAFPSVCDDYIVNKIQYRSNYNERTGKKSLISKDGTMRKPSYQWIDDIVIVRCMKKQWKIPTPKPGKSNEFGLKDHSWQALALYSAYSDGKINKEFIL